MVVGLFVLVLVCVCYAQQDDPVSFVNVLAGTENNGDFSTGNILPVTAVPFGFNHWSPQTVSTTDPRFFSPTDRTFYGFRCTHEPSPWIGDWGWFQISAQTGPPRSIDTYSPYDPTKSTFEPHYLKVYLQRYQTTMELSPTQHGAVIRVNFPDSASELETWRDRRVLLSAPLFGDVVTVDDSGTIQATTTSNSGGVPTRLTFALNGISSVPVAGNASQISAIHDAILNVLSPSITGTQSSDVIVEAFNQVGITNSSYNYLINASVFMPSFAATNANSLLTILTRAVSTNSLTKVIQSLGVPLTVSMNTTKTSNAFALYVYARSSVVPEFASSDGKIATLMFPITTNQVIIRVATSLISLEMAKAALERELPDSVPFENIQQNAYREWNSLLGRVSVVANEDRQRQMFDSRKRIFYTSLYRALLWPRNITEIDDNDNPVHYSPYDSQGRVFPGFGVTDHGFWDAYRTNYPLLTLIYPDLLGSILQGWVNAFKEGGWLPIWASVGYRKSMTGAYCDIVLIDAILKHVEGFDVNDAVDAIIKDSLVAPPTTASGGIGRIELTDLNKYGYVPSNRLDQSVSRTLDQAFIDHAVADLCVSLSLDKSKSLDCEFFRNRSYVAGSILFEETTQFFRPRYTWGDWLPNFDEFMWSPDYTEGGPWQYRFGLPHNTTLLTELHGGTEELISKLDHIFDNNIVHATGQFIHEMSEMQLLELGQYEQDNQPVHHELYLYSAIGALSKTQKWVHRVLESAYTPTSFPGDEDNGEMGSWYVFSSLGLYPLAPSQPRYAIGLAMFPKIVIQLPNGRTVNIESELTSLEDNNFPCVRWNNEPLVDNFLPHDNLVSGGTLSFGKDPCSQIQTVKRPPSPLRNRNRISGN